MMSMNVASAEPNPIRLASPMMFCVTSVAISSSPLRPLLMTQTRSKARSDSMTVMTRTMMLIGRHHREHDPEEGLRSLAPSTFAASRSDGSTPLSPAR